MAFRKFTRVHGLSVCEQHKVVKYCDNVATRLVNGENHSAVVIAGKGGEGFHNVISVIRVQTASRLVKEQDRRTRNKLASDRNTALLTTRDGPMTCQKGLGPGITAQCLLTRRSNRHILDP